MIILIVAINISSLHILHLAGTNFSDLHKHTHIIVCVIVHAKFSDFSLKSVAAISCLGYIHSHSHLVPHHRVSLVVVARHTGPVVVHVQSRHLLN